MTIFDWSSILRPADAEDTCVIRNLEGRWSVCWWRLGRVPEPFGPAFETPSEALATSGMVRQKLGLGMTLLALIPRERVSGDGRDIGHRLATSSSSLIAEGTLNEPQRTSFEIEVGAVRPRVRA